MSIKVNGALFENREKKSEKSPEHQGDFKITPEWLAEINSAFAAGFDKVKLAGWVKQGQRGKYISLSIETPYRGGAERAPPTGAPERPTGGRAHDDDVPF